MQNTLYVAEPIFSEKLQLFAPEASFPPIKKIGITTDYPERREKELLGTISPVKIKIQKAWTGLEARTAESLIHQVLDNLRLDGEYFWDGNETLVDALSAFIRNYHPEAKEIVLSEEADVQAASKAEDRKQSERIVLDVVPKLQQIGITPKITKNGRGVRFQLGKYRLILATRTGGRYTVAIHSKTRTAEQALADFPGSSPISASGTEESSRCARIPMSSLDKIIDILSQYVAAHN
jgi:hypothetical protein